MQTVEVFNAHERYRIPRKKIVKYVRRVLGRKGAAVSVIFIGSRYCKTINKRYLNHNYETDVISFTIDQVPVLEGEVYVNLDRAQRQAEEYGVSLANEVARLVIHGTLHLIGYDDDTVENRNQMKRIEDRHVKYWFPDKQRKRT